MYTYIYIHIYIYIYCLYCLKVNFKSAFSLRNLNEAESPSGDNVCLLSLTATIFYCKEFPIMLQEVLFVFTAMKKHFFCLRVYLFRNPLSVIKALLLLCLLFSCSILPVLWYICLTDHS